uniref:Phage tail length tape measure family protein n=1 Tax=Candidatus Desulfatibia profunda TaxID=2841695 RepID=A0A8J6NRR0_9BACT|nr:phage tail length tape measure family protein [Candidatus Desulfatibia profunda]
MADKETKVIVSADTSRYERSMRDAKSASDKATSAIKQGWDSVKGPMIAAAAVIGAVTYAMYKCVEAANVQEAAENRLGAVLKATGGAAGYNLDQLKKMASAMQAVTTVGDEVILSGMAILATFKQIRGEGFERTMMAAADMSEVMQQDLKSSLVMLGKAMNDPIANLSAMTRAGVQFTIQQKDQIKTLWESGKTVEAQNIILKEMESQFGGAAKAARDVFGGAVNAAKGVFGDLIEEIGFGITKNEAWIQLVKDTETAMKGAIQAIKDNKDEIKKWADAVAGSLDVALKLAEGIAKIGTAAYRATKYVAALGMSLTTEVAAIDLLNGIEGGGGRFRGKGVTGLWEPEVPKVGRVVGGDTTKPDQEKFDKELERIVSQEEEKFQIALYSQSRMEELMMESGARISQMEYDRSQREIKMAKDAQEQKLDFYEAAAGGISKTFMQIAQAGGKQSKKAFEVYKAFSLVEATISGYKAILQAMSAYPPPYSFIMAGIAGAAAAVQIGLISSAQPPSYDKGGISTTPGVYYAGVPEAHIPLQGGKVPVSIDGGGQTFIIHMDNPVFQDTETQQRVFVQIAEVVAKRVAPGAVVQNYRDDKEIRAMVRGKL